MRVLVTGGAGFIGRHTLPLLVERGFEVHAISRSPRTNGVEGISWHAGDLLSRDFGPSLVRAIRPSHLLHLAWETTHGTYWSARENHAWLEVSRGLARAFVDAGGERLVGVGSCAEYDWAGGVCDEETTPLRPATLYGEAKLAASRAFLEVRGAAWARLFFVYGPGEQPQRLASSVISALQRGEVARCTSGEQRRDFVYVEDCATALVTLVAGHAEGSFNVGTGQARSVSEVVATIARVLGAEDRVAYGALASRPDEPPLVVAAVERMKSIGWKASYDIQRGIEDMIRGGAS